LGGGRPVEEADENGVAFVHLYAAALRVHWKGKHQGLPILAGEGYGLGVTGRYGVSAAPQEAREGGAGAE